MVRRSLRAVLVARPLLHLDDLELGTVLLVSEDNHVGIVIMFYSVLLILLQGLCLFLRHQLFLTGYRDTFLLLGVDHPDGADILGSLLVGEDEVDLVGFADLEEGL